MNNPAGKTAFSLHIEGGTENGDAVPAAVLAQILTNAQRSFELIGVHVEGQTIHRRARISALRPPRIRTKPSSSACTRRPSIRTTIPSWM